MAGEASCQAHTYLIYLYLYASSTILAYLGMHKGTSPQAKSHGPMRKSGSLTKSSVQITEAELQLDWPRSILSLSTLSFETPKSQQ